MWGPKEGFIDEDVITDEEMRKEVLRFIQIFITVPFEEDKEKRGN